MINKIYPSIEIANNKLLTPSKISELTDKQSIEELTLFYQKKGVGGIILWDKSKKSSLEIILKRLEKEIKIPVIVSGISEDLNSLESYLQAGATTVMVKESIVKDINYISELDKKFGLDKILVCVDTNMVEGVWSVFIENQQKATAINIFTWVNELEEYNIQHLLINPISFQTKKRGFTTRLAQRLGSISSASLILKGYAEDMEDFVLSFLEGKVDIVTDAHTFQEATIDFKVLEQHMRKRNVS